MTLEIGTNCHGFAVTAREDLPEIEGQAITATHERSGARLLYLKNDDANKSFAIGFRTPPQDDTGVFHILEHSVLCGSRRFPVKEPFVDLLKGSMQTFLNAMTFSDKTLYPVASTNERDLRNLMDVYLDAVFHPRIYEKRQIFEQEGWHLELHAADGAPRTEDELAALPADQTILAYNGVVYNEMKGSLSDATSVLYDEVQKALLPDTCYAFESGGIPAAIPTLTYENFLDEHRRHYRTDNSYIILYGNLDIDETLEFLDERYLTPLAQEQDELDVQRKDQGLAPLRPRTIALQDPVSAGYIAVPMDTAAENACAATGYVVGNSSDRLRSLAVEILLDALFGSNEAPLKRALLDAGIAHEVNAFVSDALLQPYAMVQLRMPCPDGGKRLAGLLADEVRAMLNRGLDKELVEAALSNAEFQMREHEMGVADGVVYAMTALSSWLYDDDAATDYLRYEADFARLRESLETDYFERLCLELFCENNHTATVEIVPTPDAGDDVAAQLAETNARLASEERLAIIREEAVLRDLQEAPDSPEATATLPRLTVADIDDAPEQPAYGIDDSAPIRCVRHTVPTRGIAYAYRYFDADRIAFEDLPYLSILSSVLGKLDTTSHTAAQIDTLTQGKLGNLSFFIDVLEDRNNILTANPKFVVSASALSKNCEWLADLPREVLTQTDFSDADKILDVLKQRKIRMEHGFANSGHACATARVKSYCSAVGVVREQLANVDFYQFLCDLIDHYDERATQLAERLSALSKLVFCDDACTVSFAGSDEDYERFWRANPGCGRAGSHEARLVIPEPSVKNEAFIVPSDVCFAAVGWDRRLIGVPYSGEWLVAGRALSYDYLWNEVRVKGGAYGVGFQARRGGNMRFYSYRDPHLDETLERFDRASDWIAAFDPSDEAMAGFVVATVAGIDAPVKPRQLVRRQMGDFFAGYAPEERNEVRRQVIDADVESVRALAPTLASALAPKARCVFGNRTIIEGAKTEFSCTTLIG